MPKFAPKLKRSRLPAIICHYLFFLHLRRHKQNFWSHKFCAKIAPVESIESALRVELAALIFIVEAILNGHH